MLWRHIRPIIPRGNADLLRQIVDAVNCPALVAAANDQRVFNAGKRLRNHLDKERFPLAGNFGDGNFLFARKPVNDGTFADCANENHICARNFFGGKEAWRVVGNSRDVRPQIIRRADDARPVIRIHGNCGNVMVRANRKAARAGSRFHILRLAKRENVSHRCQKCCHRQHFRSTKKSSLHKVFNAASTREIRRCNAAGPANTTCRHNSDTVRTAPVHPRVPR